MAIDIRFPQITETSVEGQLRQLKSCLIQYSEKLNWALNTLEKNTQDVVVKYESQSSSKGSLESDPEVAASTFTALKGYIIKSADIVNAYSDVITRKLEGIYTAEASFPDGSALKYVEETTKTLKETSDSIANHYDSIQRIEDNLGKLVNEIESEGYIKEGIIRYATDEKLDGAPIIGIEVGQEIVKDGVKVFNKYSQLTAQGLYFFDKGTEVANITGYTLNITKAHISDSLILGDYDIDTSDGIMFLWEGDVEEEEQHPLTIIVSAFGTSNYGDFCLYVDGKFVKTYSGAHSTETLSYTNVNSAYIENIGYSIQESVKVSTDGVTYTTLDESYYQTYGTFDLLSLGSDTVYIRHTYFD